MMDYGYKTDTGKVRNINEDRYLFVSESDHIMLAVADGMGGHNAGDIASTLAVDEILKFSIINNMNKNIKDMLSKCVETVNKKIYEYSKTTPGCHGMGTTLTLGIINEGMLYVANVGDSRAYIINSQVEKITVDHSYVEELVMSGKISKEEADTYPGKNQITRAVGTENNVLIDIFTKKLQTGDIVLFCSDGLTNMVNENEIFDVIKSSINMQEAADKLLKKANENGGTDNITLVCYRYNEGEI